MYRNELKIGMALSGGGVRASVFHLGVLSRFAVDDLLENITFLSTVSGGTLVIGLLYSIAGNKWPTGKFFLDKGQQEAKRFLTKIDLQQDMLLRAIKQPWLLPQGRAKLFAKSLEDCWQIDSDLRDIPKEPRWVINATTYESGKNWRFIPQVRMGDYIVNYVENPSFPLADVMAASAAFPGLIGPLVLDTSEFDWFKFNKGEQVPTVPPFRKLHLWDGGLYDNLGVEALFKIFESKTRDDYNFLVVSDASKNIVLEKRSAFRPKRARRLVDIATDQIRSLRSRTLVDHFQREANSGIYLKIGNDGHKILNAGNCDAELTDRVSKDCLSKTEVQIASNFATTIRRLTEAEYDLLFRHGWEVANCTLQAHCPALFQHRCYEMP